MPLTRRAVFVNFLLQFPRKIKPTFFKNNLEVSLGIELMIRFLISEPDAAASIAQSPETLRKARYQGRLIIGVHFYKLGRSVRYHPDLLLAWATEDRETHTKTVNNYLKNQPGNSGRNLRVEALKRSTVGTG
ncbi:hypothetical protein [Anthocerotibacter panamensis]|uniref:hypothetical protein n=1 Tax=Anthocerotibacter panamensis TaxID=2857077 RepID=UPI001C407486|nr:hypothetical protein [Anthocerotibacter panamensis]